MSTLFKENREFLLAIRQALLMMVDAIERGLCEPVTTANIREQWKQKEKEQEGKMPNVKKP